MLRLRPLGHLSSSGQIIFNVARFPAFASDSSGFFQNFREQIAGIVPRQYLLTPFPFPVIFLMMSKKSPHSLDFFLFSYNIPP